MKRKQTWDLLEEALTKIVYTRDEPPGERIHMHSGLVGLVSKSARVLVKTNG